MNTTNFVQSALSGSTATRAISKRLALALAVPAFALAGCYAVPVGQDASGHPYYVYSPAPVVPVTGAPTSARSSSPAGRCR